MSLLKLFTCALPLLIVTNLNAQQKKFKIHTIAFYNLENFFDTINDPNTLDDYSPIMELKTHRREAYKQKTKNMARVIADIGRDFTNNSPTLIGVCEIENERVLEDLVTEPYLKPKSYKFIHFDSPDARGIDVALLYQPEVFIPIQQSSHVLKIYDETTGKRVFTRNQLLVSGKLENEWIHVIVNHWPSRRGGEAKSNYKRVAAAKLNKRIIDSLQMTDPYAKIIIMGDLNDNPNNHSVKKTLKAKTDRNQVGLKGIYNPFAKFYKEGFGTTAYRDAWSLFDQIMITKPLIDKNNNGFMFYKAGIYNKNEVIQQTGSYKGYPLRSWGYSGFTNGFSDHFPVYLYLIKEAD
ncbi:endonuclease/exonuclease/phosphatase family protein [Tamlana sp. s12]|uniref:endonuclease/exonuclease/phosphatase family protein n=1 Tax=Tamlana sp. s12 TaxID=1630406 RepID=UPI0007FBFAC8|nr:endonuclease [Tamlana sp. s12]OBQ57190.1 endonuclease [Tamlana sp. s12]QQY82626.1 endonuclease/exonuclease/phosphatase family protein [Tamlana sp. s12]